MEGDEYGEGGEEGEQEADSTLAGVLGGAGRRVP